ncbi:CidA/LrgA family protein [Priestia koreensis]|uniref:CidA/LrgA family protein n=1 Tax=Priestia koreensis TaxID=284581 RepID=UPI0028F7377F|nr:CidA/LrgA family protein [Priestia koreensis]
MKTLFTLFFQIILLTGIFMVGQELVRWLHLPVPGSVVGLFLLLILLQTKVIKLKWIEKGGNLLVAELLLFFIPATVGLMNYTDVLKNYGWQILLIILISTALVMASTGMIAELIFKRKGDSTT